MLRRLLRTVPALVLLLALPAVASASSNSRIVRGPLKVVGVHVLSGHGAKVKAHARGSALWVSVTGKSHRKVHLIVDGHRRPRARRVPFFVKVAARPLRPGAHSIVITAAGNVGISTITFAVMRRAPTIKVVIAPPVKTSSRSARFVWRTKGAIQKTTCKLDKGPARPCSSPRLYTGLSVGAHTFDIAIQAPSGMTTSLQRGWFVSNGPIVTFLTQPASTTTSTTASFTWHTSAAVKDTTCRLDKAAYKSCSQPVTLKGVSSGAHTFDVRVTGKSNGKTGTAEASWTVKAAAKGGSGTKTGTGATGGSGSSGPITATAPNAPFAAGASAGNFEFGRDKCQPTTATCLSNERFLLRWVARHTGTLSTLYLQFIANSDPPYNCPTSANGYGGGTSGTAQISTYPVNADGTPNTSQLLSRTTIVPCTAASSGSVGIPLGLSVTKGQEFATVVQNVDSDPVDNYFSINNLYYPGGLVGANGRNELSASATDAYYGLDPRELVGSSINGGATWKLPEPDFVPTYVQAYADGYHDGQPYLYTTPGAVSGTATMVFPRVPVQWTISQLGAYTVAPGGSSTVSLIVNNTVVASATLSGTGMLRANITPVTVAPGSTVMVRTTAGSGGLDIVRIDADTSWKLGPVLTLGPNYRYYYLEQQGGGAAAQAAVTVYPLPMYPVG